MSSCTEVSEMALLSEIVDEDESEQSFTTLLEDLNIPEEWARHGWETGR